MAGSGFKISDADMRTAVDGFLTSADSARSTMTSLDTELTGTLANYHGLQADAFWRLHDALQVKMREAEKELDTMSTLVRTVNVGTQSADSDIAQGMTPLANQADGTVLKVIRGL